jgi:hypothetical protein
MRADQPPRRSTRVIPRLGGAGEIRKVTLLAGWRWESGERFIEQGATLEEVTELYLQALNRRSA